MLLDLDAHDAELQLLLGSAEMDFPAGYNLLGEVTAGDKTYRLFKPSL